jgi:hypothetical protein
VVYVLIGEVDMLIGGKYWRNVWVKQWSEERKREDGTTQNMYSRGLSP